MIIRIVEQIICGHQLQWWQIQSICSAAYDGSWKSLSLSLWENYIDIAPLTLSLSLSSFLSLSLSLCENYIDSAPCLDSFQPTLIGALSRCSQLWRTLLSQSLKNTCNNFDKSMKQPRTLSRCSQLWRSILSHILSELVFSEPGENQLCDRSGLLIDADVLKHAICITTAGKLRLWL